MSVVQECVRLFLYQYEHCESSKLDGPRDVQILETHDKFRGKGWAQQEEHMHVPSGTGPGVRRIKRAIFIANTTIYCY